MTNAPSLVEYLRAAQQTAHDAGQLLVNSLGKSRARQKRPNDWVTEADVASENLIIGQLGMRFPAHQFLGEESGGTGDAWKCGWCWIVDPLDGTKNFIHGLPSFSVSIGLFFEGLPVVGVVHDPILKETYWAIRGAGAFLNGQSIAPSECRRLRESLLVHSFPPTVTPETPELQRFHRVVQFTSTRRLGSAALNLCYVASGRLDGYWASTLSLWDVAAGMLIAKEAGAHIRSIDGKEFSFEDLPFCVTATPELASELIPVLQV